MSIGVAFKAFFKALFNRDFSQKVAELLKGSAPEKLLPEKTEPQPAPELAVPPGAVQILGLLQREGRLIDFLQEDLGQASDAQIGAVVKSTIYSGCRQALKQYLTLEPIMADDEEGSEVTVPEGFDPENIRLVGQVQGDPPFKGILRHKGWRITKAQLPAITKQIETGVICPAEVELP
ncbi:DUF2760 domain-containing protein [bacterium]|nr:DUF2760 domain-containing protein [bacterium]